MDARTHGALQEVDIDDVCLILREPADAPTLAVASGATGVAVADQDTAEAVALRRDAIKWVTKSKDHCFIAKLVETLPAAVADEQVRLYQASKCAAVVPHAP